MPQSKEPADLSRQFLSFVQQQALDMRAKDKPPATLEEWQTQRKTLREQLIQSLGGFPSKACALAPRVVGELKRDGYRVEKLLLQTRPGVLMTANAYVPEGDGTRSAVLCVHGHWSGAKQDPVVQSRCIGLAKLGFFVLAVDAFGAGERGIGKPLGEYHGEMVAATLWPTGLTLAGLQVYENMRAVDYLQSRSEVDPDRIGITGTSGGGNQTMYAGALDERFKCVVPTCSVGTYQAYLGAACCMCEVAPRALTYSEESGVLALVAPRGLMVTNATRDAFQFSVGEAQKSIAAAREVFRLHGKEDNIRHTVVDSGHDYNQPMREAMYGWMTKHLKGEGDGSPIAEPKLQTEDRESLRCYPGDSRPDDYVTLPRFAAAQARRILKDRPIPDHPQQWRTDRMMMRMSLPSVLGDSPKRTPLDTKITKEPDARSIEFSPEPGITVFARHLPAIGKRTGLAILLDLDQGRDADKNSLAEAMRKQSWDVVTVDLRATAATANAGDAIRRAPDHNSAEWSMFIGRPLLGQWGWDVTRLLDALGDLPKATAVIGLGPSSLVALTAAALDDRISAAATVDGLASYVSDAPYEKQRLAIMVPGILEQVGDVPQLAALVAPKRLVVAGGMHGAGEPLSKDELQRNYAWTAAVAKLEGEADGFRLIASADAERVAMALTE